MLRRYEDVVIEFNYQAELARSEEIKRQKKVAEENDEDFDDRSINNKPLPVCHIPDYNRITTEIIETYLTTNSKINVQFMNDHKTKVSAIKSAIGTKPRRKVLKLEDWLEEDRLAEKRKKAIAKIEQLAALESSKKTPIEKTSTNDQITDDEDKYLAELEKQRGIDD